LLSYGSRALIGVTPVNALERLPGVQLVPIRNGRALIALDRPHSIPQLELNLRGLIEHQGSARHSRESLTF
jgi:hypothetical protein